MIAPRKRTFFAALCIHPVEEQPDNAVFGVLPVFKSIKELTDQYGEDCTVLILEETDLKITIKET